MIEDKDKFSEGGGGKFQTSYIKFLNPTETPPSADDPNKKNLKQCK